MKTQLITHFSFQITFFNMKFYNSTYITQIQKQCSQKYQQCYLIIFNYFVNCSKNYQQWKWQIAIISSQVTCVPESDQDLNSSFGIKTQRVTELIHNLYLHTLLF